VAEEAPDSPGTGSPADLLVEGCHFLNGSGGWNCTHLLREWSEEMKDRNIGQNFDLFYHW
jgi:hypothetical protein